MIGTIITRTLDINVSRSSIRSFDEFNSLSGDIVTQITAIREENKQLQRELRDITNDGTREAIDRRKQLGVAIAANTRLIKDLGRAQQTLNKEADEIDQSTGAYRRLSAELNNLRNRIKDVRAAGGIVSDQDIRRVNELDTKLKDIDASVGQFQRNVGNYSSAFDNLGGILQGNVLGGLEQVGTQIKNFTTQGASAAGVAGLIAGAVIQAGIAVNDLVVEYRQLQGVTTQTTGLLGLQAQEVTSLSAAISDTFGADFQDVVSAANSLTKEVTGDFQTSLTLIEQGFLSGANASGNFLDSLREYSSQVRAAGIDGNEFLEILIRSEREGIFSDKGIDAVKEFGLRIREQTDATKTALRDAFGAPFTDDLLQSIDSGERTTIDALKAVAEQVRNNQVPASELQAVMADVFGGAGEDAGRRFIEILGEIEGNIDALIPTTDDYTQQQIELLRANQNLREEQGILASQFKGFRANFSALGATIKAEFLGVLNNVVLQFRAIAQTVRSIFQGDAKLVTTAEIIAQDTIRATEETERLAVEEEKANLAREEERKREAIEESTRQARREAERLARIGQEGSIARLTARMRELQAEIEKTTDLQLQIQLTDDIEELEGRIGELRANLRDAIQEEVVNNLLNPLEAQTFLNTLDLIEEGVQNTSNQTTSLVMQNAEELAAFQRNINRQEVDRQKREELDRITRLQEENDVTQGIVQRNIAAVGAAFGALVAGQEDALEQLGKTTLLSAIDIVKRFVKLQLAKAFAISLTSADSIATLGAAGLGKYLIIEGIVEGFFGAVESSIRRFEGGGVLDGPSHKEGGVPIRVGGKGFVEAEGGEPILTKATSRSRKTLGVLSYINERYGGDHMGGQRPPQELIRALNSYLGSRIPPPRRITMLQPQMPLFRGGGILTNQQGNTLVNLDFDALGESIGNTVLNALNRVQIITDLRQVVDGSRQLNSLRNNINEA